MLPENARKTYIFRGYKIETLVRNVLTRMLLPSVIQINSIVNFKSTLKPNFNMDFQNMSRVFNELP